MDEQKEPVIPKVARFRILKPVPPTTWQELGELLRAVRYRVFRLANLAVSEKYLQFHLWRTGRTESLDMRTVNQLNRDLRKVLEEEKEDEEAEEKKNQHDVDPARLSKTGALPDTVVAALSQYRIRPLTTGSKWSQVIRGQTALPTFRLGMPIPIRCDKPSHRRLERMQDGSVQLDLMVTRKPYPRVMLGTRNVGGGQAAVLERLLDNPVQDPSGYRQRCFEVKQDVQTGKWWLYVTYCFPAEATARSRDTVVGVDVGVSVPLYAALSHGHARLGHQHFGPLGKQIRNLQNQVVARRRSIQRAGRRGVVDKTARAGHGVRRMLGGTEKLRGRIDRAYTTLNHQLSAAVIRFARNHGAGVIQVEDLSGLQDTLRGTFLGGRWRYDQLQRFIKYKATEAGIEYREVNAAFTSRRCSECGIIHEGFTRTFRDQHGTQGRSARFECPACGYKADADYNAARNLSVVDIEERIRVQCAEQGLKAPTSTGEVNTEPDDL